MNIARVKQVGFFRKIINVDFFTLLIISTMIFVSYSSFGQDTIKLSTVNILGFRSTQFSNDINIQRADSFVIANSATKNLGNILATYSNLNIKSYGYGGMANVNMRGGNSYQTSVLWNGFNLQDPLNGGVNLALLPGFFMNHIEIHSGGETSLFGSGAMGGSILIDSKVKFNQGQNLDALLSIGSFSNYQGGVGYSISGKRISSGIKIYHKQAQNNFRYTDLRQRDEILKFQKNAQSKQTSILQQNAFMLSSKQLLNVDFWYQNSVNHLPYNMTQTIESESYTATDNGRASLNWAWVKDVFKVKVRSAAIFNSLQYHDLNASLNYLHKSFSNISEAEADVKIFKKQLLMLGINNTFDKGISASLIPDAHRNRTSFFVSYKHNFLDKIFIKANLRQEFIADYKVPLTYSLRGSYLLKSGFSFYASYGKVFRLPTFNDLFWNDFFSKGNPNLRPEWGQNGEMGFSYEMHKKTTSIRIMLNGFSTLMNDLIQWVPVGGVWSPQNYEQVATNGMESTVTGDFSIGKFGALKATIAYTYLHSVLQKTDYIYPEDVLGKQMIFTPKHKGNMVIRWVYARTFLEYHQTLVGRIFTTSDNSEYLNPYSIGDISLGHNFMFNENSVNASFRIFNIWNTDYYVMPNYAMPGINYEISLRLKIRTK